MLQEQTTDYADKYNYPRLLHQIFALYTCAEQNQNWLTALSYETVPPTQLVFFFFFTFPVAEECKAGIYWLSPSYMLKRKRNKIRTLYVTFQFFLGISFLE